MVRTSVALLAVAAALLAAGCGGGSERAARPGATACAGTEAAQQRWLARLRRDVADLRRAASTVPGGSSLKGNRAVNAATDRFLVDVQAAPVDFLVKNRLIDHAMSALLSACEQCFQALEAERPIPAISHKGRCG